MNAPPASTLGARELRAALGRFATGVTIVTCRDAAGTPVGLTCNSFNALSLDPPLVLWSLRRASPSVAAFVAAPHFAVNVLAEDQVELSRRFASSGADKFADGVWHDGTGGAPLLVGAAATFECATASQQDAGDHVLFIGRVLRLADAALPPLVFHGGRYHLLGEIL
jgi:flavin reductase (DIM6/NTAB) family NADH-FMN oxidoreductase RutF